MELGHADDFDNAVLGQVQINLGVAKNFADEGGAAGLRELEVFLCRQSDRDVFLRFVRGCASGIRSGAALLAAMDFFSGHLGCLASNREPAGLEGSDAGFNAFVILSLEGLE